MNKQKLFTSAELIIIFFIIVMLLSTIIVTYLNIIKNYNTKSTKENHLTIISIIDSQKDNCLEESNEWLWNDKVTITCGSIFIDNQIDKFFNEIIELKNPYDKGYAVYKVSSIPNTLNPYFSSINEKQRPSLPIPITVILISFTNDTPHFIIR